MTNLERRNNACSCEYEISYRYRRMDEKPYTCLYKGDLNISYPAYHPEIFLKVTIERLERHDTLGDL